MSSSASGGVGGSSTYTSTGAIFGSSKIQRLNKMF